jgi:hypothetical protein
MAFVHTAQANQDVLPKISCIKFAEGQSEHNKVLGMHHFPSGSVLVGAKDGLYLVREQDGKLSNIAVHLTGNDSHEAEGLSFISHLPRGGAVVQNLNGSLFIARESADGFHASAVSGPRVSGEVLEAPGISQDGVLVRTKDNLYLLNEVNRTVRSDPFYRLEPGTATSTVGLPNGGVLVGGRNGLLVARDDGGELSIEPVDNTSIGSVSEMRPIGQGLILVRSATGLFVARQGARNVTVTKLTTEPNMEVLALRDARGSWVGVETRDTPDRPSHLTLAHESHGAISLALQSIFDDLRARIQMEALPDGGLLVEGPTGLLWAREANGEITLSRADGTDIGNIAAMRNLADADVLIGTEKGLFFAHETVNAVTLEKVIGADPGAVHEIVDFPAGGLLVRASQGVFLVQQVGGQPRVTSSVAANIENLGLVDGLPSGNAAIGSRSGIFIAVQSRLENASVNIPEKETLEGNQIVSHPNPSLVEFKIDHECASSAELLGLSVRIVAPGEAFPGKLSAVQWIRRRQSAALIAISSSFNRAGEWSFQVVTTFGGMERTVGNPQTLQFVSVHFWDGWEQDWKIAAIALGGAIAIANLALFALARRSAWAWRVATDDGWNTAMLRIAILALSHLRWAQLWIIDLYFQRVRKRMQEPRPFLPMPVTANGGRVMATRQAFAPPWTDKRLWMQGASGMGKTSVFRNVTEAHFREHETAFSAYAEWGCIVIPFAARDYASAGEDKDDPAWVVAAVRATLSSEGLTFASSTLLTRFLESGTIAVAIDGLNEVDRKSAVAAFSRAFCDAPILVTSQQSGHDRFFVWRLPDDVRAFTSDLIRLYLPEDDARIVIDRLAISGLHEAIRSGYDVRLVIDLARGDPRHAYLPSNRLGLYAAVIEAGWPNMPDEVRREQQGLLAAAAWRMVSERKPNEDIRRLRPNVDLPSSLLEALADAPTNDSRPVRLIRRAGQGAFEFVHDQMHAYLAARWFAQDGLSAIELERMVAGSAIWMQTPDARRILWGFTAALLGDDGLVELWKRIKDNDEWDLLERALAVEGERRGILEPRRPKARRAKAS